MSYISIIGGNRLEGEISLQGSKNATLPILAACVLCDGPVELFNCPDISDVRDLLYALSCAGVKSKWTGHRLELDGSDAVPFFFGPELAGKTRGGVLLLGAFLGRFFEAGMAYPGGCVIGARPIDLHCKVLKELRVITEEREDGVFVKGRPRGGKVVLPYPSVGATENALLAAVRAEGTTKIYGAAREPEVAELCRFLQKAGAKIEGVGTSVLRIEGVSRLHGISYTLPGDRIVAGTYLATAAMTGGDVILHNTTGVCMKGIFESLRAAGLTVYRTGDAMRLRAPGKILPVKMLKTAPFPAFPTDMQSQMTALLTLAAGESVICETVFESRFGIVGELQKLGADVTCDKRCIFIRGGKKLHGATVTATDLRTGAALVMAGLAAEGESRVYGSEFIARGYENICGTLSLVGAKMVQTEEYKEKTENRVWQQKDGNCETEQDTSSALRQFA